MTYDEEVELFERIVNDMCDTFKKKRVDYGPSTTDTWNLYGPVSMMTRLRDKINRLDNLLVHKRQPCVNDESIMDTLHDLANYAIITCIELEKERKEVKTKRTSCLGHIHNC